jgi:four helix bundle protein
VRSNYRAARRGRTRKEFRSKLGIAFEEADECMDHLRDLRESGIAFDADLFQEARELVLIFAKAVRTARANSERLKRLPKS